MIDAMLYMMIFGTVASVGYVFYVEPVVFFLGAMFGIVLFMFHAVAKWLKT